MDYTKRELNKLLKSYGSLYDFINSIYLNQIKINESQLKRLNENLNLIETIFTENKFKLKVDINKFKLVKNG